MDVEALAELDELVLHGTAGPDWRGGAFVRDHGVGVVHREERFGCHVSREQDLSGRGEAVKDPLKNDMRTHDH